MVDKAITKGFPTTEKGKRKKKKPLFKAPEFTNSLKPTKPEQDDKEQEQKQKPGQDGKPPKAQGPQSSPLNERKVLPSFGQARQNIEPYRALPNSRRRMITPKRARIGR